MKKTRRFLAVFFTLLICFAFVPAALAHPLGNFTINQYAGLHVSREAVVVDYILDMAEIPAFQEIARFDANGNGQADRGEAAAYHVAQCTSLGPRLSLLVNNRTAVLALASSSVEFPAGVGGLSTVRLACTFQVPIDSTVSPVALAFENNAFPERLGWQEVVVIPEGVQISGDYLTRSPSGRLTNYPQDLLSSPLQQRAVEVAVTWRGLPASGSSATPSSEASVPADRNDAFTRLILLEDLTLPALLLALVTSFLWGAMHAMTPGHGKTIVGAYLVGSRGTLKHALYLGLTTTITHTLGVFALGLITLLAAQYIVPETLYPWMSLLSGLFVVGIGVNLARARLRSSGLKLAPPSQRAERAAHPVALALEPRSPQPHVLTPRAASAHLHAHNHGHHHGHEGGGHSHLPPEQITWRGLLALGISGGLIPCPSALVVMLGAIALNRIGFGLVLVLVFSLGLAAALTAIGVLFIYAGRALERLPAQTRALGLLPILSALFVSSLGAAIVWKALGAII